MVRKNQHLDVINHGQSSFEYEGRLKDEKVLKGTAYNGRGDEAMRVRKDKWTWGQKDKRM